MRETSTRAKTSSACVGAFLLSGFLSLWTFAFALGGALVGHGDTSPEVAMISTVAVALAGALGLGAVARREWAKVATAGAIPVVPLFLVMVPSVLMGGHWSHLPWLLVPVGMMVAFVFGPRMGCRLRERGASTE